MLVLYSEKSAVIREKSTMDKIIKTYLKVTSLIRKLFFVRPLKQMLKCISIRIEYFKKKQPKLLVK